MSTFKRGFCKSTNIILLRILDCMIGFFFSLLLSAISPSSSPSALLPIPPEPIWGVGEVIDWEGNASLPVPPTETNLSAGDANWI